MQTKHSFFIFLLLFLLTIISIHAQEIPNAKNIIIPCYSSNSSNPNDMSNVPSMRKTTDLQIQLDRQIEMLRGTDNPDKIQLEKLNRKINKLNGNKILHYTPYPATVELVEKPAPYYLDAIQNVLVYSGSSLRSITDCFETRQTAGNLWLICTYRTSGSNPDQVLIFYSINNGQTWIHRSTITLGGTDIFNYEELDIELIEPTSADEYMRFVWGLRATAGTGRWFTGAGVYKITGQFSAGFIAFIWPGEVSTNRYYNPKIISDNSTWTGSVFVYVAVSCDSVISGGRINFQKLARCINPYTTTTTISYRPTRLWWQTNRSNKMSLCTDIAYFRNTYDSLIISYSGVSDSCFVAFLEINAPNVWVTYGCSGTIQITKNNRMPVSYLLLQNYPNPFSPKTIITFSVPKTEKVQLVIYDVMARVVSVITDRVMNQGTYNAEFDVT
jgi:hypothetical protein